MSAEQGDVEALVNTARAGIRIHPDEPTDVMVMLEGNALAALDRLAAALAMAERVVASVQSKTALDVVAEKMAAEDHAEKAERALAEIASFIEERHKEGDTEYQVAIIARAALRPSEEASDA